MLAPLLHNTLASRVAGCLRIMSWIGILKTSKWGRGKIVERETEYLLPGQVITVAPLVLMVVAEILDGCEAFIHPVYAKHTMRLFATLQKNAETDSQLQNAGIMDKSAYIISNGLRPEESFVFCHSLLIVSLLVGVVLCLTWRGYKTSAGLSPALLLVLGAIIGAVGVGRRMLKFRDVLKHGPYFAILLREVAVMGFNPSHRHQAWCMMYQSLAAAVTAAVLYVHLGGYEGMQAAAASNPEALAAFAVLALSTLSTMLRLAKNRNVTPFLLPVIVAVGFGFFKDLGATDKMQIQKIASEFIVVVHFLVAAFSMMVGSSACILPLVFAFQAVLKIHNL